MNKFDLYRAFQDISPDLMEEAERLTVQEPQYHDEKSKKRLLFLRTHEEEIMSKQNKPIRMLTGIAAVIAVCSIGVAGYYAIHPKIAGQPESSANMTADTTNLTEETVTADAVTSTTASETDQNLPVDLIEETVTQIQETDTNPDILEEDQRRIDDNSASWGVGANLYSDSPHALNPELVYNGEKVCLDLNFILDLYGTNIPDSVPVTIVMMQDGEIIPVSLTKNGKPETSLTFDKPIDKKYYTNRLIIRMKEHLGDDTVQKIGDSLGKISGITEVKHRMKTPGTMGYNTYDVKLKSELLANDENLYVEIRDKIYAISEIEKVERVEERSSSQESNDTTQTVWFTPHCRSNNSCLSTAVIYHYANAQYPAQGYLCFNVRTRLYCPEPDTECDSSAYYQVAADDDYIDFPEAMMDENFTGSNGIAVGACQNYSFDAGPNKYSIGNPIGNYAETLNRNEIYLKTHLDRQTIENFHMPEKMYALLLCDGKPVGLANGKDSVLFDFDPAKTLNYKLNLDPSITDGEHSFCVFLAPAVDTECDLNTIPYEWYSMMLNVQS